MRREGLVLQGAPSSEPIVISPESDDELIPIARVVAAISLRSL